MKWKGKAEEKDQTGLELESQMWQLPTSHKMPRLTWWWWFWLFFIKNEENLSQPKQLMILWSTKNCSFIEVNDYQWSRKGGIHTSGNQTVFDGMACSWYYDGEKMHHPFTFHRKWFESSFEPGILDDGKLAPLHGKNLTFQGNKREYSLYLASKNARTTLDLRMKSEGKLSRYEHSANSWYRNFGFDILKLKRMKLGGRINGPNGPENVEGTAYFQKVMVNAPAPPWYWSTVHFDDGSYLQYFMPHLGFPIFRRHDTHRSGFDKYVKFLSTTMDYYDSVDGRMHKFKKVAMNKYISSNGWPVFKLQAKSRNKSIDITLDTYSGAAWQFHQPLLFSFMKSYLCYYEYPAIVTQFRFKDGSDTVRRLRDHGGGYGNCEHSWGLLF